MSKLNGHNNNNNNNWLLPLAHKINNKNKQQSWNINGNVDDLIAILFDLHWDQLTISLKLVVSVLNSKPKFYHIQIYQNKTTIFFLIHKWDIYRFCWEYDAQTCHQNVIGLFLSMALPQCMWSNPWVRESVNIWRLEVDTRDFVIGMTVLSCGLFITFIFSQYNQRNAIETNRIEW